MPRRRCLFRTLFAISVTFAFVALATPSAAASVIISSCSNPTLIKGTAELAADLDCSATGGLISFLPNGVLKMNGFTTTRVTVLCRASFGGNNVSGRCRVVGPGTMVDGVVDCNGSVRIQDLTLTGGWVSGHKVDVRNSTLIGSLTTDTVVRGWGFPGARIKILGSDIVGGEVGVDSEVSVLVKDSTVRDSTGRANLSGGVVSREHRIKVKDSTISGHADNGLDGNSVKVSGSTITANGAAGLRSRRRSSSTKKAGLSIKKSSVTANGVGVLAEGEQCLDCGPVDARVSESIVTGNLFSGVQSEQGQVRVSGNTTVTGNGTDAECGVTVACADIMSREEPSISNLSSCDTSYVMSTGIPGESWGVCALD